MPRPKVPLHNRKRALQACLHCRNSKKRCNGQQPCSNCIRRNIVNSCVFEEVPPSSTASSETPRAQPKPGHHGSTAQAVKSPQLHFGSQTQTPATTVGTLASSPETSHRTHPRLLENSHGEKVFIGNSASLAFLQLIRDTVSQNLDSSVFTQHADRNSMLEEPQTQALPVEDIPLNVEQQHSLLELFVIATRGLLEVCTRDYVEAVLEKHHSGSVSFRPFEVAIAQTALAIGAQCAPRDHTNLTISRSYFASAQTQAFAGMLSNPSLEMVQLFMLMSFYMLGACQRNAAFMYMGVAARAAYVLGLHCSSSETRPLAEAEERKRITWECLITLDTVISSILGRPSAASTQSNKFMDELVASSSSVPGRSAAVQANYQLACLLDQKVQELYSAEKVTIEGARACLDQLSAWSARLPTELRCAPDAATGVDGKAQEQVIGALNVSCFYYFAVMLVSRPFLIVHLTTRLAKSRNEHTVASTESAETNTETDMQEVANACLGAATYMVQTCVETQTHGLLPNNMRILKAWLFAAGLVLGFELFTVNQPDPEIDEAFQGSRDILDKLSTHSAQAAHYFDILTSLSEAITARRRQALSHRRRTNRPIVERIMAFDRPQNSQGSIETATGSGAQATPSVLPADTESASDNWTSAFASGFDFDFQEMMNEPFLNWDSTDFLSWDPFSRVSM